MMIIIMIHSFIHSFPHKVMHVRNLLIHTAKRSKMICTTQKTALIAAHEYKRNRDNYTCFMYVRETI